MEFNLVLQLPDDQAKREQIIENICEYLGYPEEVFDVVTEQMVPNPQSKSDYIQEKVRDKLRAWNDNGRLRRNVAQIVTAVQAQTDIDIQ